MGRGDRPVVFLHGFGTNATLWRGVSARLANAGFVALAVDLLGHGESDRPLDASYELANQADVVDRALGALRVPHATVVGQDVGGLVGLALASRHPERVTRLAMLNPPDITNLPSAPVRSMQRAAARLAIGASSARLGAAALLGAVLSDAVADPAGLPASAMARYLAPWAGSGGVEQLQLLARTLEGDGVELEALDHIRTPTLVLRTDGDRTVPAVVASALSAASPGAELRTITGVGRLVAEDAPDTLARTLLEWITASTNHAS
jgi:pimeloyl-ACP methyl ester carboxylesterase